MPGSSGIRTGGSASRVGDLILVIDIGGGTTDFTLIAVREKSASCELERVAVGDHILLGGDNIDVALAHHVSQQIPKLDAIQFHALWQQCRAAKERLLAEDHPSKRAAHHHSRPRHGPGRRNDKDQAEAGRTWTAFFWMVFYPSASLQDVPQSTPRGSI